MECFGSDPLLDPMNSKLITGVFSGKCSAGSEPRPAKERTSRLGQERRVLCRAKIASLSLLSSFAEDVNYRAHRHNGTWKEAFRPSVLNLSYIRERKGEYKHGCRKERRASEQG